MVGLETVAVRKICEENAPNHIRVNLPCHAPPPPSKADCASASGKTRPFAPTARADLLPGLSLRLCFLFVRLFAH